MIMREKLVELLENAKQENINLLNFESEIIADYLLRNGVVILPCNVGDELYVLTSDSPLGYEKTKCKKITIGCRKGGRCVRISAPCVCDDWGSATWELYPKDFGVKVFLAKEEVEKALERSRTK